MSVFGVLLLRLSSYLARMREIIDQKYSKYGHFSRSGDVLSLKRSIVKTISLNVDTAWKVSKYGVFSGANTGKHRQCSVFGHIVHSASFIRKNLLIWESVLRFKQNKWFMTLLKFDPLYHSLSYDTRGYTF